jgi:hypothetical protein
LALKALISPAAEEEAAKEFKKKKNDQVDSDLSDEPAATPTTSSSTLPPAQRERLHGTLSQACAGTQGRICTEEETRLAGAIGSSK